MSEPIDAFPLSWPIGWPRTESNRRKNGQFSHHGNYISIGEAVQRVIYEAERLGVAHGDLVLSTNLRPRLDGFPLSNQSQPSDPGVAVYWTKKGQHTKVMAIDAYQTVQDNIAAIAATLEAMRKIERHGGAKILERAFAGFEALPAPGQTHARGWPEVLEIEPTATREAAQAAYRRLSGLRHPDRPGGSHDAMSELNWAWAQAQEALKK